MLLIILQNFLLNHAEPAINLSFDAIDFNNVSKPVKFRDNRRIGAKQLWTPAIVGAHPQRQRQEPYVVSNATTSPHQSHSNLMNDRQMQGTSRATTAAPSTTTTTGTTTTTSTALATKSHNENSGNNGMMIDEIGLGVTSPPSVLSGVCLFAYGLCVYVCVSFESIF
jgi:hypothetical protein